MPLWQTLYLHRLNIRCCRCFFWDRCIRNLLFFKLADTFQPVCHVQLHLHLAFSMPCGYSLVKMCILNLLFLCFTDTPHQNFASSIPKIHYLRYLLQYPLSSIYFTTWTNTLLTKNWYKKFERIWSECWRHLERKFLLLAKIYALMCLPLMESEQEFLYQFFVRNVLPSNELNSNFSPTSSYKSSTMAIPQTPFRQSYFQVWQE